MTASAENGIDTVRKTLAELEAAPAGGPVLVAVSGGPDSVCLLHVLDELGFTIEVAHFDHQTRDGLSAADAAFVQALAERLGKPFHSASEAIEQLAENSPMSFEEYARDARYRFLVDTAKLRKTAAIATGHHAGDQAETVMMRFLRGASPRGLAGIPPRSQRGGMTVIRPLIRLTRLDILAYLDERGFSFREDDTNRDPRFLRNRIRHELLPQLARDYNPQLSSALVRLSDTQRAETECLTSLTGVFLDECLTENGAIDRQAFREGHLALQRRVLLELAWRKGAEPDFARVEGAIAMIGDGTTGQAFDLGDGLCLRNGRLETELVPSGEIARDAGEVPIEIPGTTLAFGKRFEVQGPKDLPDHDLRAYCSPGRQVFDAGSFKGEVAVRHRRDGDRFSPFGMTGSKKLKDYLSGLGLLPSERERVLLLTADGEILWVVGHAISAAAAVTDTTRTVYEVTVADATL